MLARLGSAGLRLAFEAGGVALVLANVIRGLRRSRIDRDELFRSFVAFGEASVPIVLATAAFTGAIMVVQGAIYVQQYGVYNLVGWYTGFTTLREVGPILVGLMFSGRVGASHTSELATMRVREQLDALRVLALDAYELFIVPRFISMVLALTALVIIADAMAIVSGAVCAQLLLGVDYLTFFHSLSGRLELFDFFIGVAKAAAFGAVIALISTHFGMSARGGSSGVGRAVNAQVVGCAVGLFVVDYAITAVSG